ncbi:hypothetical protein HYQ46_009052 [Verticillium longisporum]|nr:hypothetical protein HYQ46_009052 [Verticillium longisporum]
MNSNLVPARVGTDAFHATLAGSNGAFAPAKEKEDGSRQACNGQRYNGSDDPSNSVGHASASIVVAALALRAGIILVGGAKIFSS